MHQVGISKLVKESHGLGRGEESHIRRADLKGVWKYTRVARVSDRGREWDQVLQNAMGGPGLRRTILN